MRKLILFICLVFFSCQKENEKGRLASNNNVSKIVDPCPSYLKKNKTNNLNLSIFLDLSDRIKRAKTVERDTAYLASISRVFIDHVKRKQLVLLEDKMQMYFNPTPIIEDVNWVAQDLKVHFTKDTPKSQLNEVLENYSELPFKLYQLSKKEDHFIGSDIWSFFKSDIKDYAIDECHRNILIILTDGYMYHDNMKIVEKGKSSFITPKYLKGLNILHEDWENKMSKRGLGFIARESGLGDLEILVLGIRSLNIESPYTEDVLKKYWSNWFEEMGVQKGNYKIKSADIPSSIEKVIQDFINN